MSRAEYRRLHSSARYALRQLAQAHESDSPFYARRMRDGTLTRDAIAETAAEALKRIPGGLPKPLRDQLLRLHDARSWRHRDREAYDHVRFVCATPRWQLRLIDAAVGAGLAAQHAVAAWKAVA